MERRYILLLILAFGAIYSLISFVNHYYFRTYALDLGAYTNALYDYLHFRWNDSSVFREMNENLLADHFDLYLIVFSPLSLLFGTYTLLVVQVCAILFGGAGVYRYFIFTGKTSKFSFGAALYFFLFFGVFSAVSYDYHSNVVAACFLPWFFLLVKQRRLYASAGMLLLIILSKENVSLGMSFICLGLLIEHRKQRPVRNFLFLSGLASFGYFLFITFFVMPALSNSNTYHHFHYSFLGADFFQAFLTLIKHPLYTLKLLFVNHTGVPFGDFAKTEFHLFVLFSGLPFLLYKPHYLLMMIPIYFQKLFNDSYTFWGVDGQYSVDLAPLMAIGIFSAIGEIRNKKAGRLAGLLACALALICTIRLMDHTVIFTNKSRIRIYQSSHYKRDFDVRKVYEQFAKIPDDAVVSAQSPFLPHLALRDKIYQFPMTRDAQFIIYSHCEETYPLNKPDFEKVTDSLETCPSWSILFKDKDVVLLKRVGADGSIRQ
jgi:uncharacterized membrane protein